MESGIVWCQTALVSAIGLLCCSRCKPVRLGCSQWKVVPILSATPGLSTMLCFSTHSTICIILVLLSPVIVTGDRCPPVQDVGHASPDVIVTPRDIVVSYTCDVGYRFPSGNSMMQLACMADDMWNGTLPDCESRNPSALITVVLLKFEPLNPELEVKLSRVLY